MKAQEFLERADVAVGELVNAAKVRMPRDEAVAFARGHANVVDGLRGTIDIKADHPTDDQLATVLLGPTGNLKAPSILVGKTLYVGFNEAVYKRLFT